MAKDAYNDILTLSHKENWAWPLQAAQVMHIRDDIREGTYQRFQDACDQLKTLNEASHAKSLKVGKGGMIFISNSNNLMLFSNLSNRK